MRGMIIMNLRINRLDKQPPLNFGWTIISEFLFCFFAGYFADLKFKSGYTWTFVGLGLAVLLVAYELWKLMKDK